MILTVEGAEMATEDVKKSRFGFYCICVPKCVGCQEALKKVFVHNLLLEDIFHII